MSRMNPPSATHLPAGFPPLRKVVSTTRAPVHFSQRSAVNNDKCEEEPLGSSPMKTCKKDSERVLWMLEVPFKSNSRMMLFQESCQKIELKGPIHSKLLAWITLGRSVTRNQQRLRGRPTLLYTHICLCRAFKLDLMESLETQEFLISFTRFHCKEGKTAKDIF